MHRGSARPRGYDVQPIYSIYGQGKVVYTADDIDLLAVHILPLDVWYILPIEAFTPNKSLRFYPSNHCKRARWETYREAWHLLEPTQDPRGAGTLAREFM
jgi:hypothetical protein